MPGKKILVLFSEPKIWNWEPSIEIRTKIAFVSKVSFYSLHPRTHNLIWVTLIWGFTLYHIFNSDFDFIWSYMWLIYGISGCFGASVIVYIGYKFVEARIFRKKRPVPRPTPACPKKLTHKETIVHKWNSKWLQQLRKPYCIYDLYNTYII